MITSLNPCNCYNSCNGHNSCNNIGCNGHTILNGFNTFNYIHFSIGSRSSIDYNWPVLVVMALMSVMAVMAVMAAITNYDGHNGSDGRNFLWRNFERTFKEPWKSLERILKKPLICLELTLKEIIEIIWSFWTNTFCIFFWSMKRSYALKPLKSRQDPNDWQKMVGRSTQRLFKLNTSDPSLVASFICSKTFLFLLEILSPSHLSLSYCLLPW